MIQRGGDRGLAEAARECRAVRHALALAGWVGEGRPVTAKRVLRRADVSLAGSVLGVELPRWVRSAANAPELHIPWTAAVATELLSIRGSRAMPGPALADWRSASDDDVLAGWSRALATVFADTFDGPDGSEAVEIGWLTLLVMATDPAPTGGDLLKAIAYTMLSSRRGIFTTFDGDFGYRDPSEVALQALSAFGAVDGKDGQWRITALGRWALETLETHGSALLGADEDADTAGVCQLKITLPHVRPACWRRVLVPAQATLGDLHEVIQIAFDWDNDHMHGFTIGRRRYGDPGYDFDYDEDDINLAKAFAGRRKPISYTYDFGDDWNHEIALEKVIEPDPEVTYPLCVDAAGDSPVEDWDGEGPEWIPLDQAEINARLAELGSESRQIMAALDYEVATILVDAYGEAEQITAFQTVLDEELDFPVSASLLGEPLVVTGLSEDGAGSELRARCRRRKSSGDVSFADLEFRPGTVEAWLHAAYLTYLGRQHPVPSPPEGWDGLGKWRA